MGIFLRIETDLLVFIFGLSMLIIMRLKSGKLSYETNWLTLLLSLMLSMQLLLSLFWALSLRKSDAFIVLRSIVFFVYYVINNTVPLLWVLYVYIHLHHGRKSLRLVSTLALPYCASMFLLLANLFRPVLYTIDASNVYHQGPLFWLNAALCYFYLLYSQIIPLANRKHVEKRHYVPLMLFGVPPFVASLIQFLCGGIDLLWASAILTIMVVYLRMVSNKLSIDYLTGVYNRMQADQYVSLKIGRSTPVHTFSGVMIDVDEFKEINDKCGHQAGDEALEITAGLLKKCLGKKDFVARLGGDEFIAILETDNIDVVRQIIGRINGTFESYNHTSKRPFSLKLSMGYDVYDYSLGMTRQQFIRHIDRLMYRRKRLHKAGNASEFMACR